MSLLASFCRNPSALEDLGVRMTMTHLDVSALPFSSWLGEQEDAIDLGALLYRARDGIEAMMQRGLITPTDSLGYALARPTSNTQPCKDWNDPLKFALIVGGWGPDKKRYIANAVRKLRAMLRTGEDTVSMRINRPNSFIDVVESVESDGSFKWGDFPWGGATFVEVTSGLYIPSSVSGLTEVEDRNISNLLGGIAGGKKLQIKYPELFGPDS